MQALFFEKDKARRKLPSTVYRKLMAHVSDLMIPIRRHREQAREWQFVVNFADVVHAFTWKLLKVDVVVDIHQDEQWIADWFISRWDASQTESERQD